MAEGDFVIDLTNFRFQTIGEAMTVLPDWKVFPVEARGKKPWGGLPWRAFSRPRVGWGEEWPDDVNTGIDCGKSGLVVLDEDEPGAVERWLGYVPETYTVRTAKGRHFYFYGSGVKNGVRVAPGVDIRADGGYVVGADSIHETGVRYSVERDMVPVPLTDDLIDRLGERPEKADVIEIDLSEGPFVLPDVIEEGTRNETLFKYACSLVARHTRDTEALVLLRDAFSRCVTVYTDESPEAMWSRALREYGRAEEVTLSKSWGRVDLSATIKGLLDGTIERPEATIGKRTDGVGLFYEGRVNGLYGDPTAGKTWAALHFCSQVMARGRAVVFVDFEDDEVGTVERLLTLGVDGTVIGSRFAYLRPEEKFSEPARERLLALITEIDPLFVVIDSTGESMAMDGTKPNDDDEVARWSVNLPKWIARRGPGVLVLDHLRKDSDGGLWPIGSQRKRAMITGAAYVQETVKGFSKDRPGFSRLKCSKDRRGGFASGEVIGEFHVVPDKANHVVHLDVRPATVKDTTGASESMKMLTISKALTEEGPLSKTALRRAVGGKHELVDKALAALVSEGYVTGGEGCPFTLVRPFSIFEEGQG